MVKHRKDYCFFGPRVSKKFFLLNGPKLGLPELHGHMLIDDLLEGLFPHSYDETKKVRATLRPADPIFGLQLANMILTGHDSYNAEDAIFDFADDIARKLIYYGFALYEGISEPWENDHQRYSLVPIDEAHCILKRNCVIQEIPENASIRTEAGIPPRVSIPRKKCFVLELPHIFGGRNGLNKLLSRISECSIMHERVREFPNSQITGGIPGYDFGLHSRACDIEMWRVTRELGYDHRAGLGYHSKLFFEHYLTARQIRFRRTQVILRDHILNAVADLVHEISLLMGYNIFVEIDASPTLGQLDELLDGWNTKGVPYNEIFEALY